VTRFLVTYDLVGTSETSQDYHRLIEKIKSYSSWGKVQKSVWLIKTSRSSEQVFQDLSAHMDSDDRLFIVEVNPNAWWINEICERKWLREFFGFSV
jgi:hypothetical protein